MNHLVFDIAVAPLEPYREILSAELFEIGFEGTMETQNGLQAFVPEVALDRNAFEDVLNHEMFANAMVKVLTEDVEFQKNWNQEWEDRFEPVLVDGRCLVRAPFNRVQGDFDFELIIQPKMSFGTGHHATTSLMLSYLIDIQMPNRVLDMGSGTGVLAIFCRKYGANEVVAIDIDDWAYENTQENMILNEVEGIEIRHGDASMLKEESFDLITANINRNVLLQDMSAYVKVMASEATLLLCGFYIEDLDMLKAEAEKCGLNFEDHHTQDNWVAARFSKN